MFEVMSSPIDPYAVIDGVRGNAGIGATVSFIGTLRGQSADGRQLSHADCEGSREEAEALLKDISAELGKRWELIDFAIRHREGSGGGGCHHGGGRRCQEPPPGVRGLPVRGGPRQGIPRHPRGCLVQDPFLLQLVDLFLRYAQQLA